MQLQSSSRFERSYQKFTKKNASLEKKTNKALEQFITDPQHPGLNLEKLSGTEVWTIRVDQQHRIFFKWIQPFEEALLIDVGKHDLYRKYG